MRNLQDEEVQVFEPLAPRLEALLIVLWSVAMLAVVVVIFYQFLSWLQFGVVPDRDLYWATAEVKCAATDWQPRGWEGMDLCRPDYIQFTDWVGVDRIINYLFDLHIAIATSGLLVIASLPVLAACNRFDEWMQTPDSEPFRKSVSTVRRQGVSFGTRLAPVVEVVLVLAVSGLVSLFLVGIIAGALGALVPQYQLKGDETIVLLALATCLVLVASGIWYFRSQGRKKRD